MWLQQYPHHVSVHAAFRQVMLKALAVLQAIDGLDADVLTIENSRSGDEMVQALAKYGYKRDIGPGASHGS